MSTIMQSTLNNHNIPSSTSNLHIALMTTKKPARSPPMLKLLIVPNETRIKYKQVERDNSHRGIKMVERATGPLIKRKV